MKTAKLINQIKAGEHLLIETTKQNIFIDLVGYQGKSIPFDELMNILNKRFDEANAMIDEDE